MAIPDTKLILHVDPEGLTLDDLPMFDPDPGDPITSLLAFRGFLRRHSEWTSHEIGQITLTELKDVLMPQIKEAVTEALVPKENETGSATGPQETQKPLQDGSSSET